MEDKLYLYEYDQSYIQFDSEDRGLLMDLSDYFTFDVPNAKYMPSYQNKMWDGKYRLADLRTFRIYRGLLPYIVEFCKEREYAYDIDTDLLKSGCAKGFDLKVYVKTLGLIYTPYDYQQSSFEHAIKNNRATLLSPTNSGKSLIIYMMIRYYLDHTDEDILLCVPTVDLVGQLIQEFIDYAPSFNIEAECHKVYQGQAKRADGKRIIVSTWQSIYKQPKKYFESFGTVIIDEAHLAKADSLKSILQKSSNAVNRFGLTGTLDNLQYNRLIIEGLCGPVKKVTTNKELIDKKISSDLNINCLVLKYNDEVRQANRGMTYQQEMKFISEYAPRTNFIAKLCKAIGDDKNSLVLTQYKNHIDAIAEALEKIGKTVYVVTGDTPVHERTAVRKLAEQENGIVIVATYGVYSTGINIKNLQYMIMATGSKSLIRVLQSIGRGLRRDGKANKITVIDIIDDFGWKKKKNYIVNHFFERIKIYVGEKFKYKIKNINI